MNEVLTSIFGGHWKQHPDHPRYFFCSDGRVASTFRKKPRLLIGCECGLGYRAISCIIQKGAYKRIYIHRAVCALFNGAPTENDLHVRHLDGDMTNNKASNLAWGTPLENMNDMRQHGRTCIGEKNAMAKITRKIVEEMKSIRAETGKSYSKIAQQFGISTMTAFRAIKGEAWA